MFKRWNEPNFLSQSQAQAFRVESKQASSFSKLDIEPILSLEIKTLWTQTTIIYFIQNLHKQLKVIFRPFIKFFSQVNHKMPNLCLCWNWAQKKLGRAFKKSARASLSFSCIWWKSDTWAGPPSPSLGSFHLFKCYRAFIQSFQTWLLHSEFLFNLRNAVKKFSFFIVFDHRRREFHFFFLSVLWQKRGTKVWQKITFCFPPWC